VADYPEEDLVTTGRAGNSTWAGGLPAAKAGHIGGEACPVGPADRRRRPRQPSPVYLTWSHPESLGVGYAAAAMALRKIQFSAFSLSLEEFKSPCSWSMARHHIQTVTAATKVYNHRDKRESTQ